MSGYLDTYTESHALLVGINDYTHPVFQPLGNAQDDATDLADLLASKPYYFHTHLLLGSEATKQAVLDALFDLRHVDENSRVIVYFAGHGYTIPDQFGHETGYLACTDTIPQRDYTALELEEVMDLRRFSTAKHIAFVFDSCFSGQALGMTRLRSAADRFIERRAYQVLSAGAGDQAVSDRRSMTQLLLRTLDPECVHDCLRLNAVALCVQEQMARDTKNTQIPQFGHIEGSQGGDLVFYEPPEVQPIDRLPERLQRGLLHQDPDTRYFAIERAEKLLDDPRYGASIRAVLDDMHTDDPNREVRRRAYEALHPAPPDTSVPPAAVEMASVDISPQVAERTLPAAPAKSKPKTRWPLIAGLVLGGLAAVICGIVGLGALIPGLWATSPQVERSTNTPAWPTDTPEPILTSTLTLTDAERDELALSRAVESNAEWTTPVIEVIDGVEMVLVPAGCFPMGSSEKEIEYALQLCEMRESDDPCTSALYYDETPQYEVCIPHAFWIGRYEVTRELFLPDEDWSDENHPYESAVWSQANAYCQDRGMRLPTEAEWEYAARGPDGLLFPWGNEFDGTVTNHCDVNCDYVKWINYSSDDGYQHTAPVDGYDKNVSWVGAFNMSGNVWEWVNDWYDPYYYALFLSDGIENPLGPETGTDHVQRGGSWASAIEYMRAAARYYPQDDSPAYANGFRCARTYEPSTDIPIPTPAPTPTPTLVPIDVPEDIEILAFYGVYFNDEWTPYTTTVNGVEMALVPAGYFMMGSTEEEIEQAAASCLEAGYGCDEAYNDEGPRHEVDFDEPFWIDVSEVTNGQYGGAGSGIDDWGYDCEHASGGDDQPRICITWDDAQAYCESRGARLPTEAEWAYAARGPESWIYPWGNELRDDAVIYNGSMDGQTGKVDDMPEGVSWVGAFDLSGNVWEWVNDWYEEEYDISDWLNPKGPESGDYRVLRGGAWMNLPVNLRAASRDRDVPDGAFIDVGFRCARSY